MKENFVIPTSKKGEIAGYGGLSGESSHRVILSKMAKGSTIFFEASKKGQPLISSRSSDGLGSSHWDSSIIELSKIKAISKEVSSLDLKGMAKYLSSFHATIVANQIGEPPAFLMLKANTDDAKITFASNKIGRTMVIPATNMPVLVRRGCFFFGTQGIILDRYVLTGDEELLWSNLLGFKFFQKISGYGYYAIAIEGDCPDPYRLYPGELIHVEPSKLIAMSSTVSIIGLYKISDSIAVRNAEGKDFELYIQANALGGWVIISDLPQTPPDGEKK